MAQDGGSSPLDFHPDLDYFFDSHSMDNLSIELDDLLPRSIDHNVPVNAPTMQRHLGYELASTSSHYHTTPGSSKAPSYRTPLTVYTSNNPSSLGESSGQYQHKPQQAEPLVDYLPSQTDLAFVGFVGFELSNSTCPPSLNITSGNDAGTVEPTVEGLYSQETISPPSASGQPGSDSRRITTSHNLGFPSPGAQSTANDDPLRDAVMWRLGQNPTRQRMFQLRQDLAGYCADLDARLAVPNRVAGVQMPPPQRPLSVSEPKRKQRSKPLPRVAYRCGLCWVPATTRQSCKRHVETKHHPQYDYHCDVGNCTVFLEKPLHRLDKLVEHYSSAHSLESPSESTIEANRDEHPHPPFCTLCSKVVYSWDEFYDCFLNHCQVKPAASKASSSRDSHGRRKQRRDRDNSDKGNFNGGTNNGGFVSQEEYGHSGNAGGTSNPWPSGYGGNQYERSHQQGGCNQHSSRPELDMRDLQDQPKSQESRSHCNSCQHPFDTCSDCCNNPPSTGLCHACPDVQLALAMQAGVLHAGPSPEPLPHTGQTIVFVADHVQTNPQAFCDVNPSVPTIAAASPSLYRAPPQGSQQLGLRLKQQAQACGLHSGTDTQQSFFASEQSLAFSAVDDVRAVGISKLKIGPSIFDPKNKNAQILDNWSGVLAFRGSSPAARKSHTGVNIATPLLLGPLSSNNKVNLASICQCQCRTRSPGTYFAQSRVEIAPGRRIEMDFKMAPEARGLGHPLRTRIHVVVKILRLRSSVAKSANGKHKQEAHAVLKETPEAPLELTKAGEPPEEEEKEIELIFDLDLQSSLSKLSRWIRLPTGNISSDLSVQDPDRVFEYFVRCMLFVLFAIVSLARVQDYNPHPCLAKRRPGQPQDDVCHASYYDFDTRNSHMIL